METPFIEELVPQISLAKCRHCRSTCKGLSLAYMIGSLHDLWIIAAFCPPGVPDSWELSPELLRILLSSLFLSHPSLFTLHSRIQLELSSYTSAMSTRKRKQDEVPEDLQALPSDESDEEEEYARALLDVMPFPFAAVRLPKANSGLTYCSCLLIYSFHTPAIDASVQSRSLSKFNADIAPPDMRSRTHPT